MRTEISKAFWAQRDFTEVERRRQQAFVRLHVVGKYVVATPDSIGRAVDHYNCTQGLVFTAEGSGFLIVPAFCWVDATGTLEKIDSAVLQQDFGPFDAKKDSIRHGFTTVPVEEFSRWFDYAGAGVTKVTLTQEGYQRLADYRDWFDRVGPSIRVDWCP